MISRRRFVAGVAILGGQMPLQPPDRLCGVFPILSVPLNAVKRLDREELARQVELLNRGGCHGMVWPHPLICDLSPEDRMAGAEIVMTAKHPLILGVQGADIESTRRYARHAEKIGPSAVMAARYFRAIAAECGLSLMAQAGAGVSVEFVLRLRDQIKTLRLVEDSAGHTLSRISEYRRRAPDLAIFTKGAGRTMPDELERGASGVMPPARYGRDYVRLWKYCLAGRRDQAIAGLSQIAASPGRDASLFASV